MKLEDQVVNLELSKQLKELGVKQESVWSWFDYQGTYYVSTGAIEQSDDKNRQRGEYICSAFGIAELGKILPHETFLTGYIKQNGKEEIRVFLWDVLATMRDKRLDTLKADAFQSDTEADARAKMLIYLLENKLI